MKKRVIGNLITFSVILIVFVSGIVQTDSAKAGNVVCTIRQEILMRVPEGAKQRKFPVPFHHTSHKKFNCTDCHHNFYETFTIGSCSVEGCHFNTKKRKGTESFYAAFHSIFEESDRSCVDCHKTRGEGPTTCKTCHIPK